MEALFVGKVIDNYKILEIIGYGGMGMVLKAHDQKLDRIVAIKVLEARLSQDPEFSKRFIIEGRSQAKLHHPNIISIFDLRENTEIGTFIVMEYVEGESLSTVIRSKGYFMWDEVLPLAKQLLSAIAHAHEKKVVHRDIKPGNIMVSPKLDMIKVADFGLAKIQHDFGVTTNNMAAGTILYSAPEQIESLKNANERSDIYSIGMTLYEMLAGKLPFSDSDSTLKIMETIVSGKIPPVSAGHPDIPHGLAKIVEKATAKSPGKRYQSAEKMLSAVKVFEVKAQGVSGNNVPEPTPPPFSEKINQYAQKAGQGLVKGWQLLKNMLNGAGQKLATALPALKNIKKLPPKVFYGVLGVLLIALIYVFRPDEVKPPPPPDVQKSLLQFYSEPEGAAIFVNDDSVGTTPFNDFVTEEKYLTIALKKDTYFPLDTSLFLAQADTTDVTFALKPAAELSFNVNPPDAIVTVNADTVDSAAYAQYLVEPGVYAVTVSKPGYLPKKPKKVTLAHGEKEAVSMRLTADRQGTFRIETIPPGAEITFPDHSWIRKRRAPRTYTLQAGRYRIRLELSQHETIEREIVVVKDSHETIKVRMALIPL